MRSLVAALIRLFSLPAADQDLDALFRDGMAAVEEAYSETDKDRRDALLDEAIAAFRAMLVVRRFTAGTRYARAVKSVWEWCKQHRDQPLGVQHRHLASVIRGHCA